MKRREEPVRRSEGVPDHFTPADWLTDDEIDAHNRRYARLPDNDREQAAADLSVLAYGRWREARMNQETSR
jgi:hypothetical protein